MHILPTPLSPPRRGILLYSSLETGAWLYSLFGRGVCSFNLAEIET